MARAAAAEDALRPVGVAGYEGTLAQDRSPSALASVDGFLDTLRTVTMRCLEDDLLHGEVTVSAGGSLFFDRVVARLRDGWPAGATVRVLLRGELHRHAR